MAKERFWTLSRAQMILAYLWTMTTLAGIFVFIVYANDVYGTCRYVWWSLFTLTMSNMILSFTLLFLPSKNGLEYIVISTLILYAVLIFPTETVAGFLWFVLVQNECQTSTRVLWDATNVFGIITLTLIVFTIVYTICFGCCYRIEQLKESSYSYTLDNTNKIRTFNSLKKDSIPLLQRKSKAKATTTSGITIQADSDSEPQ